MKPNKICKGSFIMAVALAAVFAHAAAWPSPAAAGGPQECGLIGTWLGSAGPISWSGIHTAGSKPTNGEMLMNWVNVSPYLYHQGCSLCTMLTPGNGVWEQIRKGVYRYSWYAYATTSLDNPPSTTIRVSGYAYNVPGSEISSDFSSISACDAIKILYVYEVFAGFLPGQALEDAVPIYSTGGDAFEIRVPMPSYLDATPPPP